MIQLQLDTPFIIYLLVMASGTVPFIIFLIRQFRAPNSSMVEVPRSTRKIVKVEKVTESHDKELKELKERVQDLQVAIRLTPEQKETKVEKETENRD